VQRRLKPISAVEALAPQQEAGGVEPHNFGAAIGLAVLLNYNKLDGSTSASNWAPVLT